MALKYTTEEIIDRFKAVHGDKYSYDSFIYCGYHTKGNLTCRTHGCFPQSPAKHIAGKGCPVCGHESTRKHKTLTTQDFLDRSRETHGDRYDYSLSHYVGKDSDVTIICREHGPFSQGAATHWSGANCRLCAYVEGGLTSRKSQEDVISEFKSAHGDKYDYSLVRYVLDNEKVSVICPDHGVFDVSPSNHKRGKGCPACAKENSHWYSPTMAKRKKSKLEKIKSGVYLIRIDTFDGYFLKIGLSYNANSRAKDISNESGFETTVIDWIGMDQYRAILFENHLHKKYKQFKIDIPKFFQGYTECFSDSLCISPLVDEYNGMGSPFEGTRTSAGDGDDNAMNMDNAS